MIDFKTLRISSNNRYSFVGIEKKNGLLYFNLPKGFLNKADSDYDFKYKKVLFFKFYRLLSRFKLVCLEKGYLQESSHVTSNDRDGSFDGQSGSHIERMKDDVDSIFYSKLDFIDKFIESYDELKITSLRYRLKKGREFDISQIHRYLHKAIYLENDVAFVDEILLPKKVVEFESIDIVLIYSFVLVEIRYQIGGDLSPEILSLSESFRQKYLRNEDSIFDEDTFEIVLSTLKESLDTINQNTYLKDHDYWQFYDAVELFLYGDWLESDNGYIWGINNFHTVWESMCLTYIVNTFDSNMIKLLDDQYVSKTIIDKANLSISTKNKYENIFVLNHSQLRPDVLIHHTIDSKIDKHPTTLGCTYNITKYSWDDYGYWTSVIIENFMCVSIAYLNQEHNVHTFDKLSKIYSLRKNGKVVIDSPLSKEYYSYWRVNINESIDREYLHRMRQFNHLFYIALRDKAFEWNDFCSRILNPLGINFLSGMNDVFTSSLLRHIFECQSSKEEEINKFRLSFESFIKNALNDYNEYYELVDIKYFTEDYFFDPKNNESIKSRSIRKQFVYEYLLENHLKINLNYTPIHSSFWIPTQEQLSNVYIEKSGDFFMNFINLYKVDFMHVLDSYLST